MKTVIHGLIFKTPILIHGTSQFWAFAYSKISNMVETTNGMMERFTILPGVMNTVPVSK